MQGFETVRDDSDLRAQGWAPTPATPTRKTTTSIPSVTGVNGFSLRPIGAFQTMSYSTAAWGSASDQTFGALNTGITLRQAWNAGGITLGYGARFNSGATLYYGTAKAVNPVYDGSLYWATQSGGSSGIATSPDLTTWTPVTQQLSNVTGLGYVGSNMVTATTSPGTSQVTANYSTNHGASWTAVVMPVTGTSAASGFPVIQTGNSTYPHLLGVAATNSSVSTVYVLVGNLTTGASSFKIATQYNTALGAGNFTSTVPRIIGGYVTVFSYQSGVMNATNAADLSTGWSSYSIGTSSGLINDLAFLPGANLYVMASTTGIYTIPNPGGTVGTPGLLSGTLTPTLRSAAIVINQLMLVGSYMVALGPNGYIASSTDGVNWTALTPLQNNGAWMNALYDGSKYAIFSDTVNGLVATSPDLKTNFQTTYASESAEFTFSLGTGLAGAGLMLGTAPSASTGQWSPVVTTNGFPYLVVTAISAGTRQYAFYNSSNTTTALASGTFPYTTGYHYYEWKYTTVAGTTNMFNLAFYVDGVQIAAINNYQMSTTADTTSLFLVTFQRNGTFTAFDDVYVTLDDGTNSVGPLGQVNIFVRRPTTDVQAQWTKVGTAASNSLTVNQPAMSSQSANYVTSNNPGDKDIYSSTDTMPSGYSIKAVQVEGYFTKASTSTPSVSVGVVSGSSESDGTSIPIGGTTPVYTAQIVEKDPNGNVAWTNTSVNASRPAINHIS